MIINSVPEDDIRFCPYCGHKTDVDYIYCSFCGKKLPRSPVQQFQPDTKEKTVPAPSAEKPAPASTHKLTGDTQKVHHDDGREALHQFKKANASWLSDSNYDTLLNLMESAIRKRIFIESEEVFWREEDRRIRVFYEHDECGYHDETSGENYYVELRQYTGETDRLSWESSDLPCEGQAVIKHESKHEDPFGSSCNEYDDVKNTVRVLKRLFGSEMYWEFTEYFHSYYC